VTLRLARTAREAVLSHARAASPEEACGVLAGRRGDPSVVESVRRAENAAATPQTDYEIAPAALFDHLGAIERAGREVVGFYHSHPAGPAEMSATDRERAAWEDYSYLLVALDGRPSVASWRWRGDRFEPETVRVINTPGERETGE
jgi:proteasome lid subunit RPN8/RPN11